MFYCFLRFLHISFCKYFHFFLAHRYYILPILDGGSLNLYAQENSNCIPILFSIDLKMVSELKENDVLKEKNVNV